MTTQRTFHTNGRWTSEEHRLFIEGLAKYGKDWKKIEEFIQTRDGAQIRSHAQKFFLRMTKEYKRIIKNGNYNENISFLALESEKISPEESVKKVSKIEESSKVQVSIAEKKEEKFLDGLEKLESIKKAFELSILSLSLQSPQRSPFSELQKYQSFYTYMEKDLFSASPAKRKLSDLVEYPSEVKEGTGRKRLGSFTLCKKGEECEKKKKVCQ